MPRHGRQAIHQTAHGKAQNPRTPEAGQGCESCHGPGSAHLDDPSKPDSIKRFPTMKPRDVSDTCLTCHSRGNHTQWKGSMHDARNLSCITCHSVHNPKSEKSQLKAVSIVDTCKTCHTTEVAKQQRVGHMPVREGKMDVHDVPQSARLDQRPHAEDRQLDQRDVHQLPHREARAVPLGSRAGPRGLQHLPRSARVEQRPDARRQTAGPLSELSHRHRSIRRRFTTRTRSLRKAIASSAGAA